MIDILINIAGIIMIPTFIFAGSIGVCYCINPDKTKEFISRTSWEMSKLYVRAKDGYELIINDSDNESDSGYDADNEYEEYDIKYNNLLFLDNKGNTCVTDTSNSETIKKIMKLNPNPVFLEKRNNKEMIYKRIILDSEQNLDDFVFTKSKEDPFIQVEYIDDNNTLNLHDKLKMFYISDNKILDKEFIRFIIKYYFDKEISDSYIIRIFDRNINQFELKNNSYVVIRNDKELGYEIIENEIIENEKIVQGYIFTDSENDDSNSEPSNNPIEF